MTTETDELDEVWALIRELDDVSARLNRAAAAAMQSLGIRSDEGKEENKT